VRTLEGTAQVAEPTMDLMSPDLALAPTRTLGPDDLLILKHLPRQTGAAPVIAASSACVECSRPTAPSCASSPQAPPACRE